MGATAGKIAKIILEEERRGALDLSSYRASNAGYPQRLRELSAKGHHPAHAALIYAQNFASVITEQISDRNALRQFTEIVDKAQDDYQPGFPPLSPLTNSHFTSWAFFDVLFGRSRETIGACLLRLAEVSPLPSVLVDAIGALQQSRLGFYAHEGIEGDFIRFREIGGDGVKLCLATSGFTGARGQIWFGRLVPATNAPEPFHVLFTTPYVLVQTRESEIAAYLKREVERLNGRQLPPGMDARDFLLKHGPTPNHWNEYIFCAYSNFRSDAVFIKGVPDDRASLPHGELMRVARR